MTDHALTRRDFARLLVGGMAWGAALLTGCGASNATNAPAQDGGDGGASTALADGSYSVEVETDSSMFRADSCTLTVEGGKYHATLVLPGEGFSRLFFGTAEEAANADDASIYDYHLNDEEKYTFDIPVSALDEELPIAAYGQRRDTWYDHTIIFHSPASDAQSKAA